MKHVNQRTKTWSVQDIGLNVILLWKHENNKIEIWCKIIPKINVEYTKRLCESSNYTLLKIELKENISKYFKEPC